MASIGLENGTGTGPENETTIYILGDRGRVPDAERGEQCPDRAHDATRRAAGHWSPSFHGRRRAGSRLRPKIDQKLNRLIDNPIGVSRAGPDRRADGPLKGSLCRIGALPDGSASPPKLVWKKPVVARGSSARRKRKRLEEFASARHLSTISASIGSLQ